jgi:hypothetical protein
LQLVSFAFVLHTVQTLCKSQMYTVDLLVTNTYEVEL